MSTQTPSPGIPLTLSDQTQHLRLVELPPELLDLLSAPQPPRIYLKSPRPRTPHGNSVVSTGPASKAAEHLHLCTPSQSYQVRQVSTSNSVYVIEPSMARPASSDEGEVMELDDRLRQPSNALTAIAKVDTMLELLPVSHDVKAMIEGVLPLYDTSEVFAAEEANSYFISHSAAISKHALFSDIPAPDSQIERAWRVLLAFEFQGRCARPSASTSLTKWRSISNYATLEHLDLNTDVNLKGYFQTEQASPLDAPVVEAILSCLADRTFSTSAAHAIQLDRLKVVAWTGTMLLQAMFERPGSTSLLLKDDYISQWQDLLPEAWREDATLSKLPEDSYTVEVVESKDTIRWEGLEGPGSKPVQTAASEAAKATTGKRKWHEKFKAQRKESKK